MNLAVIGGYGLLGSTTAFFSGTKGLFDNIYLIGRKQNVLMSHVMDMGQALSSLSNTRVFAGDYDVLNECGIILFTASAPEQAVDNRNEYLLRNVGIVREIAAKLKQSCDNKIILCATNPVDVFNYALYRWTGWERDKFLGFGSNDTLRLRWALSKYTGLPHQCFEAYVLGEHGDLQVPVMSQIRKNGELMRLDEAAIKEVRGMISGYFREFQALNGGRTSGWTSSVAMTSILEAIVKESNETVTCSAVLDGEYGEKEVSVGVPLKLCNTGIREIVDIELSETERLALHKAAEAIRGYIGKI